MWSSIKIPLDFLVRWLGYDWKNKISCQWQSDLMINSSILPLTELDDCWTFGLGFMSVHLVSELTQCPHLTMASFKDSVTTNLSLCRCRSGQTVLTRVSIGVKRQIWHVDGSQVGFELHHKRNIIMNMDKGHQCGLDSYSWNQ